MNNFQKWWLGTLTFIVATETTLIGIYCCSNLEVNSNSPSVLISALGVLVTFVVAWQIWQTIDAKNSIREFEKKTKDYETDLDAKTRFISNSITEDLQKKLDTLAREVSHKEDMTYHHLAAMLYDELRYYQSLYNRPQSTLYNFMEHSIEGLRYGIEHNDIAICRVHLTKMYSRLRNASKQILTDEQIKELVNKLNRMQPLAGLEKSHNALIRGLQGFWDTEKRRNNFDEDEVYFDEPVAFPRHHSESKDSGKQRQR